MAEITITAAACPESISCAPEGRGPGLATSHFATPAILLDVLWNISSRRMHGTFGHLELR